MKNLSIYEVTQCPEAKKYLDELIWDIINNPAKETKTFTSSVQKPKTGLRLRQIQTRL